MTKLVNNKSIFCKIIIILYIKKKLATRVIII